MSEKNIFRIIFSVSLLIFILVIILNRKILPRPEVTPSFVFFLPKLNAVINSVCTVLLLTTYYFIRRKKIKRWNLQTKASEIRLRKLAMGPTLATE